METNTADATRKALTQLHVLSVCVCMCACAFQHIYMCVHRSVHISRTSAPREIDFCLLRSIALIKRKTKEAVGNMNRREMYPISVHKGKPDSSTLLRLSLLHWLPQAEVFPLILIFWRLCTGSKHWLKLFAINIIFTSPFIHTDINTHKETSQQELFISFSSMSHSSHTHVSIVISKKYTGEMQPLPNSLVVCSLGIWNTLLFPEPEP